MSIIKKLLISCLCISALSAVAYAETELPVITGEQLTAISAGADIKDVYFNDSKTEISVITADEKPMVSISQISNLLDLSL